MKFPLGPESLIESLSNPLFKRLKSLTHSKGLNKEGLFILSGEKIIQEFLKSPSLPIEYVVRSKSMAPLEVPHSQLTSPRLSLTSSLFDELDSLGTGYPLLILNQPTLPTLSAEDLTTYSPKGLEVVIPIGDPSNLGALLRSCEAFGIQKVILTEEAAHPFLPKALKASAGSLLRLSLVLGPKLSELPRMMIALDSSGTPLTDFIWPKDALLVVGEEGPGFGREAKSLTPRFQHCVKIPTTGVESLNVVVAASIALYHHKQCQTGP